MFEWSEEQLAIRDAVRRFVEEEVKPNVEELEHGDTPPYEVIRKLYRTFGLDALARDSFKRALERKTSGAAAPERTAQDCAIESMRHSSFAAEPNGSPSSKKARRYQSPSHPSRSSEACKATACVVHFAARLVCRRALASGMNAVRAV